MTVIDISATNIVGMGATRLAQSLLPALERRLAVRRILVPHTGELRNYRRITPGGAPQPYVRRLPNGLSRILECTIGGRRVAAGLPLLVLGDLPVRADVRQVVLVHQPHIISGRWQQSANTHTRVLRAMFALNQRFISVAVVQSEVMKAQLAENYPALAGRIEVISQPAPAWLLEARVARRKRTAGQQLRLFYPAAAYAHKNHRLLEAWATSRPADGQVESVSLTLPKPSGRKDDSLEYLGPLSPLQMIDEYSRTDALVFPSLDETLGLPLVEAMFLGLPILCSDRPFARALCGDAALYFDPKDPASLQAAVEELWQRLNEGWTPDWTDQLGNIPTDWDEVAARFAALF